MRKNVEIYQEGERRIVKGLGAFECMFPDEIKDFKSLLTYIENKYGEKTAFLYKRNRKVVKKSYSDFVKEVNADLFISLHINASEYESVYGTEVYYSKSNNAATKYGLTSSKLAQVLVNKLYVAMDTKLRGALKSDFYVVKYNSVPAVLIELGFISNKDERSKLVNNTYQQKAAKEIYESVIEIFSAYPTGR